VVADGGNDPGNEPAFAGVSSPVRDELRQSSAGAILTPDQRVRVFISSTLEELAAERASPFSNWLMAAEDTSELDATAF
jgi:hypothetical protein